MIKHIKINPAFFIVLLITYFLGFHNEYLMMFLIVSIHEFSHIVFMKLMHIEISRIRIEAFGINIRMKNKIIKDPDKEIAMALSGPFVNLLLASVLYIIYKYLNLRNEDFLFFIFANLCIGLFNLIPALPLDGGRILKAYLSKKTGYLKSYRFVLLITKIISILLIFIGIYIVLNTGFNFSVCLIGSFLYFNVLIEKNHSYYYLLQEISEYKKKNRHLEKMPVRYLAVDKNMPVRKILCELSVNRYYIVVVIDGIKQIAQLTEGELIEGLIVKGAGTRIMDLI